MNASQVHSHFSRLRAGESAAVLEELRATGAALMRAPRVLRGLAAYDAGDLEQAAADLNAENAANPESPVVAANLALVRFRQGHPAEAHRLLKSIPLFPQREWLERALELFWPLRFSTNIHRAPNQPEPSALPHDVDFQRFRLHRGRVPAGRTVKLSDRHIVAGENAFHAGRRLEARLLFERAVELHPENEPATVSLAYLYLVEGRPGEARRLLEPLMRRDAEGWLASDERGEHPALPDPNLLSEFAWVLHEEQRHDEALALLACVRPAGPDDWGSHFIAAMCWMMKGDRAKMRLLLDQALGPFFLDTWEQQARPFLEHATAWIGTEEAREQSHRSG